MKISSKLYFVDFSVSNLFHIKPLSMLSLANGRLSLVNIKQCWLFKQKFASAAYNLSISAAENCRLNLEEKFMQPDLNQMMQSVQKMQRDWETLQGELATTDVVGSAGGDAVKVTCTGALEFKSIKIKAEAVDPADTETLEDLILVAIKDACQKAKALGQDKMAKSFSGIPMPPGLGF
jgi:DNA-binding YbaB/EbfC family protein